MSSKLNAPNLDYLSFLPSPTQQSQRTRPPQLSDAARTIPCGSVTSSLDNISPLPSATWVSSSPRSETAISPLKDNGICSLSAYPLCKDDVDYTKNHSALDSQFAFDDWRKFTNSDDPAYVTVDQDNSDCVAEDEIFNALYHPSELTTYHESRSPQQRLCHTNKIITLAPSNYAFERCDTSQRTHSECGALFLRKSKTQIITDVDMDIRRLLLPDASASLRPFEVNHLTTLFPDLDADPLSIQPEYDGCHALPLTQRHLMGMRVSGMHLDRLPQRHQVKALQCVPLISKEQEHHIESLPNLQHSPPGRCSTIPTSSALAQPNSSSSPDLHSKSTASISKPRTNLPRARGKRSSSPVLATKHDAIRALATKNVKLPTSDNSRKTANDGMLAEPIKRSAHNLIEKRYRTNLNDKIALLRDSIPSLRIAAIKGSSRHRGSMRTHLHSYIPIFRPPSGSDEAMDVDMDSDGDGTRREEIPRNGHDEDAGPAHKNGPTASNAGNSDPHASDPVHASVAQKLNKGTVLSKATEYIAQLELSQWKLRVENAELRRRMMMGLRGRIEVDADVEAEIESGEEL